MKTETSTRPADRVGTVTSGSASLSGNSPLERTPLSNGPTDLPSAAIIVTYNRVPSPALIATASQENSVVILVDNSDNPLPAATIKVLAATRWGVKLIATGENRGMARALNSGVGEARRQGCYWFHILDDDADVSPGFFHQLREMFRRISDSGVRLGALGPTVTDRHPRRAAPSLASDWSVVSSLITSGTLTSRDILDNVGGYNETLFVEGVDFDFSRRLRSHGFSLVRLNNVLLSQPFGAESTSNSLRAELVDWLVGASSRLSILANRSNSYHTRYGCYPLSRRREYWHSFRASAALGKKGGNLSPSLTTRAYILSAALLDYIATGNRGYITTCIE